MTILIGGYVGAKSCTGGPRPGVKGAMSWFLGAYREEGGTNLGIYNCRPVRGGKTSSIHSEGRAGDWGTPVVNDWSWDLVELLRMHSAELGIQCIIHRRRIWSSSGGPDWRPYTGVAAHFDHGHIEWVPGSANADQAEMVARFERILGDPSPIRPDGHVIDPPKPSTPDVSEWREIAIGQVSEKGTRGEQCRSDQAALIDKGFPVGPTGADGFWGENAVNAARAFQAAAGIGVDGAFGSQSRVQINRVPSWNGRGARDVQQRLKDRGWKINVDGAWGPKSAAILKKFQKEKGLVADGLYGPATWTALWTRNA